LDPQRIAGPNYFGNTSHKDGDMVHFVSDDLQAWRKEKPGEVEKVILALSAEAGLPAQAELDKQDRKQIAQGRKLIQDEEHCAQCHTFRAREGIPRPT